MNNDANNVSYNWAGDWAKWEEFQNHPELKNLLQKSTDILSRSAKGSKGASKGLLPHRKHGT